jgi:hypothetical protein
LRFAEKIYMLTFAKVLNKLRGKTNSFL